MIFYKMKVLSPPFVDYFLHHLIEHIDPQLAITIGQSWCPFESVHASFFTPLSRMAKAESFYTQYRIWLITSKQWLT